jgi:predicted RND superfamily exporter protein
MPLSIQKRYVSEKTGRISLYVYPKEDVWDPKKMDFFIKELRTVDPNITGTPVEVYESSRLLEKSFHRVALYSLIAIILIVFIDFKNLRLTILALTPLTLGMLWLFELMGLLGIRFNLANFFGIPILLGVGVDNAVQIVHRYLKEKDMSSISSFMTKSTGIAVLLTSLTTFASFVTLVFARHKGIASLGLIMSLGTLTCFVGSMIILPCTLKIFTVRQD